MSKKWWPCIRIEPGHTVDSDHNNFYTFNGEPIMMSLGDTSYHTIKDWRTATGKDINSITGDPQLGSDGRLKSFRSPCIGTGKTLSDVTFDYFGTTRTEPYDIGAHAFK